MIKDICDLLPEMTSVQSIETIRRLARQAGSEAKTIGFVPTMGALHEGHLSLIRRARRENDLLVVSIFVNPLQFGPDEDFEQYPRNEERDALLCDDEGIDLLFLPPAEEIYRSCLTSVTVKGMDEMLCGPFRPGHFQGVATVVLKLFNMIVPCRSYFGEKDYQQLIMIKKMVRDLNIDMEVIGCPIVRGEDGLALSSRNSYLDEEERERARAIPRGIAEAGEMVKKGERNTGIIEEKVDTILKEARIRVDYVSIRDTETLEQVENIESPVRILIAGRIGGTRLIDNATL